MTLRMTIAELNQIIACPLTKRPLSLVEEQDARCPDSEQTYPWLQGNWDLIPRGHRACGKWSTWEQLQHNGAISYRMDPERNLAVGARQDTAAFAAFCRFDGLVLDVGCGPQPWPAYFQGESPRTRYLGVDPLIVQSSPRYVQLRALAEYLPLLDQSCDQVVFATSLDHFVDPLQSLLEARRVCRPQGTVCIWLGEKSPDAPRPPVSPEWYQDLHTPSQAEDPFHFKRLVPAELEAIFHRARLEALEHQVLPAGPFRWNHFYRLRAGECG